MTDRTEGPETHIRTGIVSTPSRSVITPQIRFRARASVSKAFNIGGGEHRDFT